MSLEEDIRKYYSEECIKMICGEKLKNDPRLIDADALKDGYEYMGYDATEHCEDDASTIRFEPMRLDPKDIDLIHYIDVFELIKDLVRRSRDEEETD